MLWLLPWFIILNLPPKLISNSFDVKVVSEQHMESECLLQRPEEEDHWIQSLEPLPVPWHEHASAPLGTQIAFCSWSIALAIGLQDALHKNLETSYVYKAEE